MNDNDQAFNCRQFELLISCSLDGELTENEQLELTRHLQHCHSCNLRRESFLKVNELAGRLGIVDEMPGRRVVVPATFDSAERKSGQLWASYTPLAGLAGIAAAILIWLGVYLPGSKSADASEIVVPLVSLAHINSTRQEDQAILKESMELDLRTLKIQMDSMGDEDRMIELNRQFEQLLKRLKEI